MVRPRWQGASQASDRKAWQRWNKAIACIAMANFSWCIFDISYVHLRSFWLNREINIANNSSTISLSWLPNITKIYDPIKGIEPHQSSAAYVNDFSSKKDLVRNELKKNSQANSLLHEIKLSTIQLLENIPINSKQNLQNIETIKTNLTRRSGESNYNNAIKKLLTVNYLNKNEINGELAFWENEVIKVVNTNYSKKIDGNGRQVNLSWIIDIPFQLIFIIDITLRTYRVKRKYSGIGWKNAFLKRWIDIPLFLPFFRILRLIPVTERLSYSKLINVESLRAVISQWIVGFLALEIFELITLRVIDSFKRIIKSPNIPERVRSLCSYQTVNEVQYQELNELIRIWIAILLTQIGPNLRPRLISLFDHALQKSITNTIWPERLKNSPIIEKAESAISFNLASGMVDTLLDLSKNAGKQLSQKDLILEKLSEETVDRFWEELAYALENKNVLLKSQDLIISVLEEFKVVSFRELKNQSKIDDLMTEIDDLNFNEGKSSAKDLH